MQSASLSTRREYGLLLLGVCFSISTGILSIGLFAFVFQAAEGSRFTWLPWPIAFALLATLLVSSRIISVLAMTRLSNGLEEKLRLRLAKEILSAPLHLVETVGTSRLLTSVTADVTAISKSASQLVQLCVSAATIVALFCYMIWLSPLGALCVLLPVLLGGSLHWTFTHRVGRLSYAASQAWDLFCRNFEGLIRGFTQLKLNYRRREQFVEKDILTRQSDFVRLRSSVVLARAMIFSFAQALFLLTLGVLLLFLLQSSQLSGSSGAQFIFATIYLMGPLEGLLSSIMALGEVRIAHRRLHDIGLVLSLHEIESEGASDNFEIADWNCLTLRGLTYAYPGEGGFAFGPIDTTMKRGEIVFVTGGNGSGKSTFAKLVAGLYIPTQGELSLDDSRIDDRRRASYREQFSAVLDEAYVFERIWSKKSTDLPAEELLETWGLQSAVKVRDGCFTNTAALSRGQKKRLAMVSALMEDRPVYIFDEWAADQDAMSREHFYRALLPNLRRSRKLVIVLTHDEGYDDVADKVLHLQGGTLALSDSEMASYAPKYA